ncbi:hypothetical protein LXL04_014098 [Taraxacum kok-saghyz]
MEELERLAWVKVIGLPVNFRCMENLTAIGSCIGRTLEVGELGWVKNDMTHHRMCILTKSRKIINEEIRIIHEGKHRIIGINEVEVMWHPFNNKPGDPMDVRITIADATDSDSDDTQSRTSLSDDDDDTFFGAIPRHQVPTPSPESTEDMEEGEIPLEVSKIADEQDQNPTKAQATPTGDLEKCNNSTPESTKT